MSFPLIDFHNHFVAAEFTPPPLGSRGPEWVKIWKDLQDVRALLHEIESGDINARVVSSPASVLTGAEGSLPEGTIARLNDTLAELVADHPNRLVGLVGVDIFTGDTAAREIERGIKELGLRGVFIDSAKGDLLPDAPEARAGLAAAHELGVPIFLHPVNPAQLTRQLAPYGRLGTRIARGTINSAALAAFLEGGVFDALPDLHVVVTTLAIGGVLLAGAFDEASNIRSTAPPAARRNIYIDTMGLDPALIRASVAFLGADHVVLGTDWPIASDGPIRQRAESALAAAGLSPEEQRLVGAGNALRLLGGRAATQRSAA